MDTILSRYRNITILVTVLFAQVLGLAFQVRRQTDTGPVRLVRVWSIALITPLEKAVVHTEGAFSDAWHNYFWLRGVRRENEQLKRDMERMRLEEIRLAQDAEQARRLQRLLAFKEQVVSDTVAAQVIGSSGSETSRVLYIDKGTADGIKQDMAVITPDGVVGKILRAFHGTSQVLLITDPSSGVGALLSKSRLQGILKGTASGEVMLNYVMSDEKVEPGEQVLTSGGDRIFPKGMPIGTVTQVSPGPDLFLNIRVKPAAQVSRLEEVLVVTRIVDQTPPGSETAGPVRAADILAQRLPTVTIQPLEGALSATGVPPSTAELARAQKATKAAANKNPSTGVPPSTLQLYGSKPAAKPATPANTTPGATGASSKPTQASGVARAPAQSQSPEPSTPLSQKQGSSAPPAATPKPKPPKPTTDDQRPTTPPPGVTL